ncbi:hypothetical protein Y1Q_0003267 [Alligator mississippiensis]|uniref:Uncharacterized protein n=1 Tax=Alligator mississippiensis TaxID=8496 RepID=A0A151ME59_ALLMI|nr:hypothetical protein Y1Q_0003267 [Alligator mississippiensis]
MEEAQVPETDVENLEDGIFVPEPACEVEFIAEESSIITPKDQKTVRTEQKGMVPQKKTYHLPLRKPYVKTQGFTPPKQMCHLLQ